MNLSSFFHRLRDFIFTRWNQLKNFLNSRNPLKQGRNVFLFKEKFPSFRQILKLHKVLSRKEQVLILCFLILFVASLTIEASRFYLRHVTLAPSEGGIYTEGLIGAPRFINPLFSMASDVDSDITALVFSGLLRFKPEEGYVPDLAESYEISDDKKIYTFHLRNNIKWHDGVPFSIDDIIFTIKAIQNGEYASPLAKSFLGVTVEKVDEKTVRFHLPESYIGFKDALTTGILPEHIWLKISPRASYLAEFNLKPIGTGPFRFKSFTRDKNGEIKSYTLERNKYFYNKKPYLDKIVFRFYPNSKAALAALKNGEIDGINFLPQGEILDQERNILYYPLMLPQYSAIFLNIRNEILKDKNIRQALVYATDKEKILKEVLGGKGQILHAPIPRGFVGFYGEAKKYNFDLVTAETILDKAGWKKQDNWRKKNDTNLEITLAAVDKAEQSHLAEIIKKDWESIGIKVKLQIVPSSEIQKIIIKPRLYDALIYGEIFGSESDLLPYWHSSQTEDPGLNLSGFSNALVDKYLEELRKIDNVLERTKKLIAIQDILVEEVPAIFLYSPTYIYPVSKKIKGIEVQKIIIPRDRFASIENWFIRQKRVWKK